MAEDTGGFSLNPLVLLERLRKSFAELLSNLGHGFVIIFGIENITLDTVTKIESQFEALVKNTERFVQELKDFKFDPKYKTRVVLVPRAIEAAFSFWDLIHVDFIQRIKDVQTPFLDFKTVVGTLKEGLDAAGAGDGSSAAARKVAQIEVTVKAVNRMLGDVSTALEKIQSFEDLLQKIKDEVETLDSFFLPQGNSRMPVQSSIGPLRVRLGKLHKEDG